MARIFVAALVFLATAVGCAGEAACVPGGQLLATGGKSFRWPEANPALVAPASLHYAYSKVTYPLEATFTGEVISIPLPGDYSGGFTLATSPPEKYVLKRIEVRNPAQVAAGTVQALAHVLELALVHQQVGGNYWANVIVPFQVSGVSEFDALYSIVTGATMPTGVGEIQPVIVSGSQALDVNSFFGDSTFLNFWTELPTQCVSQNVPARQFMRSATLNTGFDTMKTLQTALGNAVAYLPLIAPAASWLVNACNASGICTHAAATPLGEQLTQARTIQSVAVLEFRERKSLMDTAYTNLVNHTNASNAEGNLKIAISARSDLLTASQELESIATKTQQLENWFNASNHATWDHEAPPKSSTEPVAAEVASNSTAASLLAAAVSVHEQSRGGSADCKTFGMSPVDINKARVVDPGTISPLLREPLVFSPPIAAPRLLMAKDAPVGRLRVAAADGPGSDALGAIVLSGVRHPISYVEVVAPAEHAVDGRAGDVELQLVHAPVPGRDGSAIAISLRLQEAGERENPWISSLLQQSPHAAGGAARLNARPLADLHDFLRLGSAERYFRYDGTLTAPPCTSTQWLVLEEPGYVSKRQLEVLTGRLGGAVVARQRFHPSLVAFGTPTLVTRVSSPGLGSAAPKRLQLRKRRISV
eukprot:CAMPEP_0117493906 /NCGR_PEP_ID=MMETSP0784-20121206/19336_1 /TAXON_ID=39447 /ORGANISM="" /LENGTH=647 /DNA_ID=CAMNT_0005288767 /DNA_START=52 /DNA_END=1995 /DNA_ORIENTATION=-